MFIIFIIIYFEVAVAEYVVYRLIRRKSLGSYPRVSHQKCNMKNISAATSSQQISGENSKSK